MIVDTHTRGYGGGASTQAVTEACITWIRHYTAFGRFRGPAGSAFSTNEAMMAELDKQRPWYPRSVDADDACHAMDSIKIYTVEEWMDRTNAIEE